MAVLDVLLIQPPVEDFYFTHKRTQPYGLACIASALGAEGYSVEILDALAVSRSRIKPLPSEMDYLLEYYGQEDLSPFALFHHFRHYGFSFQHIGKLVRDKKPFLVGISSLFTAYAGEAMETARAVKKFWPQCRVVMGGHHPTQMPAAVLAEPAVDFILRGEGEVNLPLLVNTLKKGGDLAKVPGIGFRREDGSLFISSSAFMENLEYGHLPDMALVNMAFYKRRKKASAVVVTGRGCPMGCSYCSMGASSAYPAFRQRSVASVLAEIEALAGEHELGFIDFEDENLTLNRSWAVELLQGIESLFGRKRVECRAMNGLYPPSLDDDLVRIMKRAGFRTLNLSLGSTSGEQLKRFRRPDVRPAFERALVMAEEHGLEAVSYILAGAPGQEPLQSVDDLLYLAGKRTLIGLSVYYPAPGSMDYEGCSKEGLLPDSFSLMRSSALPVSDTTTRLQSVTLLRLARMLNFMKALRSIGRTLLAGFFRDGKIRGMAPGGVFFGHRVDLDLSRYFKRGLKGVVVRGVAT